MCQFDCTVYLALLTTEINIFQHFIHTLYDEFHKKTPFDSYRPNNDIINNVIWAFLIS